MLASFSKDRIGALLFLGLALSGCVGARKQLGTDRLDEAQAREAACGRFEGRPPRGLRGSVSLSLKTASAQGQASADLLLTPPERLRIEGHDPFGSIAATFSIEGEKYEIDTRKMKGGLRETGQGDWSGLPIRWMYGMFEGRLPCPKAAPGHPLRSRLDGTGAWTVEVPGGTDGEERFQYAYKLGDDGRPWVLRLKWSRLGPSPLEMTLEIPEWDEREMFPKRWEAHGLRSEVKVRWKNREWLD